MELGSTLVEAHFGFFSFSDFNLCDPALSLMDFGICSFCKVLLSRVLLLNLLLLFG